MRRWHAELSLMIQRQRVDASVRAPFDPRPLGAQRKRHPHDCGNPRCGVCHGEKAFAPKRRAAQLRSAVTYELASEA